MNNEMTPHFEGIWISETTHEKGQPKTCTALIFVGEGLMVRLDLDEDDEGNPLTESRTYGYVLDGEQILVAREKQYGNKIAGGRWKRADTGKLSFEIENRWFEFIRSTRKKLVEAGFDRIVVDSILDSAKAVRERVAE